MAPKGIAQPCDLATPDFHLMLARLRAAIGDGHAIDPEEQALWVAVVVTRHRHRAQAEHKHAGIARKLRSDELDYLGAIAAMGLYSCLGCHYVLGAGELVLRPGLLG
jgi:hypothetical protein